MVCFIIDSLEPSDLASIWLVLCAHLLCGTGVVDFVGAAIAVVGFVAHMDLDLKPCNYIQRLFGYVVVVLASTPCH